MPNQHEPSRPNLFQHFLRGVDAAKSTAMASLSIRSGAHDNISHQQDLIYAATLQLSLAAITIVALVGRVYQDPSRLKANSMGILLRTGIIVMDVASGALLLSDLEEKTLLSSVGKSLMACSIFASRLVAEDGHHDQINATEHKEENIEHGSSSDRPLLSSNRYGATS